MPVRTFDAARFRADFDAGRLTNALLANVFYVLDPDDYWRGVAHVAVHPTGVDLFTGPSKSRLAQVRVTVEPDGSLDYDVHPIDHIRRSRSIPPEEWESPWYAEDLQRGIASILTPYIVEDTDAPIRERARELRGLAEASKAFEIGSTGKAVPEAVQSNVASFLSGEKWSAGPPQMQMKALHSKLSKRAGRRRRTRRITRRR